MTQDEIYRISLAIRNRCIPNLVLARKTEFDKMIEIVLTALDKENFVILTKEEFEELKPK
jgi:hypothetical protein